jgi:hypothetical protein
MSAAMLAKLNVGGSCSKRHKTGARVRAPLAGFQAEKHALCLIRCFPPRAARETRRPGDPERMRKAKFNSTDSVQPPLLRTPRKILNCTDTPSGNGMASTTSNSVVIKSQDMKRS